MAYPHLALFSAVVLGSATLASATLCFEGTLSSVNQACSFIEGSLTNNVTVSRCRPTEDSCAQFSYSYDLVLAGINCTITTTSGACLPSSWNCSDLEALIRSTLGNVDVGPIDCSTCLTDRCNALVPTEEVDLQFFVLLGFAVDGDAFLTNTTMLDVLESLVADILQVPRDWVFVSISWVELEQLPPDLRRLSGTAAPPALGQKSGRLRRLTAANTTAVLVSGGAQIPAYNEEGIEASSVQALADSLPSADVLSGHLSSRLIAAGFNMSLSDVAVRLPPSETSAPTTSTIAATSATSSVTSVTTTLEATGVAAVPGSGGDGNALIIGIVAGIGVVFVAAAAVGIYCRKSTGKPPPSQARSKKQQQQRATKESPPLDLEEPEDRPPSSAAKDRSGNAASASQAERGADQRSAATQPDRAPQERTSAPEAESKQRPQQQYAPSSREEATPPQPTRQDGSSQQRQEEASAQQETQRDDGETRGQERPSGSQDSSPRSPEGAAGRPSSGAAASSDKKRQKPRRDRRSKPEQSSSRQRSTEDAEPPPPARPAVPSERADALKCLGITSSNPSADEIKKAYRQAALEWHPDRPQNRDRAEEATRMFQEIQKANDFLLNGVGNSK